MAGGNNNNDHSDDGDHDNETDEQSHVAVEEGRPELREPPRFAVVLLNDDYSTMEFVIEVLQRFFHKQKEEAMQIMLAVHNAGKGVAGIYSRDIAETKAQQVHDHARGRGFPLRCEVESII